MNKQEFLERFQKNDNRGTAQPYLLLLQTKRYHVTEDGEPHYVELVSGNFRTAETELGIKNILKDYYEGDDTNTEFLNEGEHWRKYHREEYWETVNVFLTDEGYREHLELNAHNLGEHRTYGICAFRNPEMRFIFEQLGLMDVRTPVKNKVDEREFYDLMQTYRHSPDCRSSWSPRSL